MNINIAQARYNMVEQQIRTWDVLDQQVLDLVAQSPREEYLPEKHRNLAYVDTELPIAANRYTLTPKLEARILQELTINKNDKILELGSGNGYLTSLLASLGNHVYSFEPNAELLAIAKTNLRDHEIKNVTIKRGDLTSGWMDDKPYDVIVINGSIPEITDELCHALAIKGRLFTIVGSPPVMEAVLTKRFGKKQFSTTTLFETQTSAFPDTESEEQFVF